MKFSQLFLQKVLRFFGCLAACCAYRKREDFEGPHKAPLHSKIRVNGVSNSNVYGESFRVNVLSKVTGKNRLQKQFKTLVEAHCRVLPSLHVCF